MKRLCLADMAAVLVGLVAAIISYQLLRAHVAGSTAGGWIDRGCSVSALGDRVNCAAVLSSPYAYVPPRHEDRPSRFVSLPAAFLGLVYFTVIFVWFLGIGRPGYQRRWLHLFPAVWIGLGLTASAYFIFIMASRLDVWCSWCAATHVLNLLLAVCVFLTWPRRQPSALAAMPALRDTADAPPPSSSDNEAHPSTRRILLTCCMIATVAYTCSLSLGMMRVDRLRAECREYQAEVDRMRGDVAGLVSLWKAGAKHDAPLEENVPRRSPSTEGPWFDVVIFSDFECPACAHMAAFLDQRVSPLFSGRLRLTYRHFPLHAACNAAIPMEVTSHPFACEAAGWAEAARLTGGNDAFWRAHDYLFKHQSELRRGLITMADLASAIDLEQSAMQQVMSSAACHARLTGDVRIAQEWGVPATPTLFADGRLVPRLARNVDRFWDALANHYWTEIAREPRPASTRLNRATPGTPDRPDAP